MKRKIGGFNESTKVKIIRENYTHYENTLQVFSIIEASVKRGPILAVRHILGHIPQRYV